MGLLDAEEEMSVDAGKKLENWVEGILVVVDEEEDEDEEEENLKVCVGGFVIVVDVIDVVDGKKLEVWVEGYVIVVDGKKLEVCVVEGKKLEVCGTKLGTVSEFPIPLEAELPHCAVVDEPKFCPSTGKVVPLLRPKLPAKDVWELVSNPLEAGRPTEELGHVMVLE